MTYLEGCERRRGRAPMVVFAPHGGRRLRQRRPGDRVNDLHTAAMARELAGRLDAHALINHGLDRNDVDLNRIEHLAERAPGVLGALRDAVEAAGEGGRVPLVVLLHGWNVTRPVCDLGVGLRAQGPGWAGRWPTLGRAAFESLCARLEAALEARGARLVVGERYAATGRDNATQLFSGRHVDHEHPDVAALAGLGAAGRVDAAQLELGIPLRWPDGLRRPVLDALVEALAAHLAERVGSRGVGPDPIAGRDGWALPALRRDEGRAARGAASEGGARPAPRSGGGPGRGPGASLQGVLAGGEVGVFASVDPIGRGGLAARLSVVRTDGTMALFVAEGRDDEEAPGPGDVAPEPRGGWEGRPVRGLDGLRWAQAGPGRLHLRFEGWMIEHRSHDSFLDLEGGLASSHLTRGRVEVAVDGSRLEASIEVGGARVTGSGFARLGRGRAGEAAGEGPREAGASEPGEWRRGVPGPGMHLAGPGPGGAAFRERARTAGEAARDRGGDVGPSAAEPPGAGPSADGAPGDEARRVVREHVVTARVPVRRALPGGGVVALSFGLARCRLADGSWVDAVFEGVEVPGAGGPPARSATAAGRPVD